jgi:tellurite resistance protein TerC
MEFLFTTGSARPSGSGWPSSASSSALTAFDLGILHKEDKEMGIGESLKLSAFYIGIALLFGAWVWARRAPISA